MSEKRQAKPANFIRKIVAGDLETGKCKRVRTRFPPEPNGYLHIGHAKAIFLNFGIAQDFNGSCNLRFDDTNPDRGESRYVLSIQNDIAWLGIRWDHLLYASDYFEEFYALAVELIHKNKAYVCSLSAEEIRSTRGTLTEAGVNSPFRNRVVDKILVLFQKMKDGECKTGEHVLRAKIDMSSGNINMRDPVIYRIRNTPHYRTKKQWHIYPTYDFAHCLSDSLEGVTHSLCTLEFEDHRPLYDWFLASLNICHPQQIEFARLQLKYALTSKRAIKALIRKGSIEGWDDPRLVTIAGMRRRGFPPEAIRDFCLRVGLTKKDSWTEMDLLESCVRDYLNEHAARAFAVLEPLKLVIENYPDEQDEVIQAPNHPQQKHRGSRPLLFSRNLYIERQDFMENPTEKYFRLAPGREVRLKYAYYLRCREVIKNTAGEILEVRCTYDPDTLGGKSPDRRKVPGTIHWLARENSRPFTAKLYDRLFSEPFAATLADPSQALNQHSLVTLHNCLGETSLFDGQAEQVLQFERMGYFCLDRQNGAALPVFNRTLPLRDSWRKIERARAKASHCGNKQKTSPDGLKSC